jgi:hypothetical protein
MIKLAMELIDLVTLLIWGATTGAQIAGQVGTTKAKWYLVMARRLAYAMIIPPFVFLVIGVLLKSPWIIMGAALWCGAMTIILLIWSSPIVGGIHFLLDEAGATKTGARNTITFLVNTLSGILVAEEIIALTAMVLPLREHPEVVPFLVVPALGLWIASVRWGMGDSLWRKVVVGSNLATIGFALIYITFPRTTEAVMKTKDPIDTSVAQMITCASVEAEEAEKLGCPSPTPPPPPSPVAASTTATLPFCSEVSYDLTPSSPTAEVPIQATCWSGWVHLPPGRQPWEMRVKEPVGHAYLWADGSTTQIRDGEFKDLGAGYGRRHFRLRSLTGSGVARVSITP